MAADARNFLVLSQAAASLTVIVTRPSTQTPDPWVNPRPKETRAMFSKSRTTLRLVSLENRTVPTALIAHSFSDVSSDYAIADLTSQNAISALGEPVAAMDASRGEITVPPLPKKPLLNPMLNPPSRFEISVDRSQVTTAIPLSSPTT
jgi:hypothetical protein